MQEHSQEELGSNNPTIFARIKSFLFARNFTLVTSLRLTLTQAITLIIIEEFQKISIVTRTSVNPTLSTSPEMVYINEICKAFLLDIFGNDSDSIIITMILLFAQILILLAILLPIKGEIINQILSKYLYTFMEMVLTMPSIIISVSLTVKGVNIGPNIILYLLTITTNIIYQSMQIQCSFQRENLNFLVRTARPLTLKIVHLTIISIFPIITHYFYPVSFAIYGLCMLLTQIYSWLYYLHKFIYFHEELMYVKGIMLTINISTYFCYLIIYLVGNAIVSQNILLFIAAFSIFLGNFFVTYRKHILKNVIINKELKGDNQISMYCVFYWHCYTKITEKKNELYISSLLKKHTNQCVDPSCCCKNRENLYETYLKTFGNPKIQPHFDKIFIRHFIKKLLFDGYEKFNKSSMLALLISNYNIEVVQMITQTMDLIRKLSKMQQKRQLYFTEQFLLYCLKAKTRGKIIDINFKRGNADLESVKQFDTQLFSLHQGLKTSVKLYHNLWKQLQNPNLNQNILYNTCKNNLELMFSIEKIYKQLKNINNQSTQLRTIMLFYARLVVHDIHLLSQIKKDIKNCRERNILLSTLQQSNIQLFGNNTATFISLQNSRIKWTNRKAHKLFEYSKEQFHMVTIKQLMPKYFAQRHDYYIQRWKTTGHHTKLNKTAYLWANTKNGTCFSMLMYVKAIPLLQEQEYGFFSCIEKIDDQAELICNQYGEVYGAGKLFAKATNLSPRFIQEAKMNIQVFIPFAFEYFLQFFYPKNTKVKNVKKNSETRRQGYFPQNLQSVLKDMQQQKSRFLHKHQKDGGFLKQFLGFVRKQMQEITCNINGQYLSLSFLLFKNTFFHGENGNIIALKVSNPKKETIEKYYADLQKMINKLQNLSLDENSKHNKTGLKRSKSDFFKVFLNPRRMKKLLERQQQQLSQQKNNEQPHKSDTIKQTKQLSVKLRSERDIVAHRKLLASGAQRQIKNDRVRYNFYKIKKILLEEGIISRYTFNLLIGKNTQMNLVSEPTFTERQGSPSNLTFKQLQEKPPLSEDDRDSINHDSEGQLAANKQNDNETFNSASSSATFISMTNHVKMFKLKLRSLNTPRPLLILNLIIIAALIASICGFSYLTVNCIRSLETGMKEFQNNEEANIIIDSLLLGQFNINMLQRYPQNIHFITQRTYFLTSVSQLMQRQMFKRAQFKKIDTDLLQYLTLIIKDDEILTIREFIPTMLSQIRDNKFQHLMLYFAQAITVITEHSENNLFFDRIVSGLFLYFVICLVIALVLFVSTIPVIWKLQIKIKEIYGLMSKVSTKDKQKYLKHFLNLNEQFKGKDQLDCNVLLQLTASYQHKTKVFNSNTKINFSQDSISRANQIR